MKRLICLLGLFVVGCVPSPTHTMDIGVATDHRIKVVRIDVIEDWTAYQSRRGIYVITDSKTGKEYIGVSGVGITETGSHQSGKTLNSDER